MRRLIFAFALLLPLSASADWSITATWTRSTGATMDHEQVYYDGAPRAECLIPAGAPTTCQFVLTDVQMGKSLWVWRPRGWCLTRLLSVRQYGSMRTTRSVRWSARVRCSPSALRPPQQPVSMSRGDL